MPKQRILVELFIDGVWTDLVSNDDVFADTPIIILRGDGNESAALRPTNITLRLNNDSDIYRTSNPISFLYGKAGVNTPLRITVNDVVRGIGEVTSWRCGQSRDFRTRPRRGKAWTDIEANGIFWRINQWTQNVESTMTKGMRSFTTGLVGAWPLEDERDSTVLTNLVSGGFLGSYTGAIDLGDSERPAGSGQSMKLDTAAIVKGKFLSSTNSGWQISFAIKLPSLPGSATFESVFNWYDSVGRLWVWKVSNLGWAWDIFDSSGTLIDSNTTSFGTAVPTAWVRCRMKVSVSGGTLTWEPAWYAQGQATPFGISDTFASSNTGYIKEWNITALTYNAAANYVAVFGLNNATQNMFNPGITADFNGHVGETTGARFTRLLNDLGIPFAVNGTVAGSVPMGAQPVAKLSELLREIRDTEDGILYESKGAIAPIFDLKSYRYNKTPLTLDLTDELTGFPNVPEEVTDDLPIHNIVTVTNLNGGSATAEDSTSPMGSAVPPVGRGEYRQNVDVSLYNPQADLPQHANWWMRRGTVNLPSYPTVTILVSALSPSKLALIENTLFTVGSVFVMINYRENIIRLQIIGFKESISTHSRTFQLTCIQDQQFNVGTYDSGRRFNSKTTVNKTALGKLDTSVTFRMTDGNALWSQTSVPYDVMCAGERMTVKTMAAPTGTGPYEQVASVVRSVNGVIKPISANEPISIFDVAKWAL